MTNGRSRRALAAGAAALATSTLAQDVADARRGPTATHHLVIDGQVTVERNRVTIDRVVHAFRVGSDGTSERIHDHGRFVPPAGGYIDYRLAGLEQVGDGSRGLVGAPRMFSFRATGGSHDPQAGRLVLPNGVPLDRALNELVFMAAAPVAAPPPPQMATAR